MADLVFAEKYVVQEEIAKGGMGVIYRALDRTLNRVVAIKLVHAHLTSDSSFAERFLREARAMARLHHENIVTIFSVEQDRGTQFLVMEYFSGSNLRSLIRQHTRLPLREAVTIALQLAHALAYAHGHGIVHRDIKPANILIGPQSKTKLTDFGIAAALDDISITSTGQVIGTPEYMSPEQARGLKLDGRSDLYSVGIVFYEMLTGQTPYRQIPKTAILGQLMSPHHELRLEFPGEVPSYLHSLIRELTRPDPTDRLESAEALATQLTEILYSLPTVKSGALQTSEPASTVIASGPPSASTRPQSSEFEQTRVEARTAPLARPSSPRVPEPTVLSPTPVREETSVETRLAPLPIEQPREPLPSVRTTPRPTSSTRVPVPHPISRRLLMMVSGLALIGALAMLGYQLIPPLDTSSTFRKPPLSPSKQDSQGPVPNADVRQASTSASIAQDSGKALSPVTDKDAQLEDERRRLQEDQARLEEKQRQAQLQMEKEEAERTRLREERSKQNKERERAAQRAKQAEQQRQAEEAAKLEHERQKLEAQRASMEAERKRIVQEQEQLAKEKERVVQQANIEEQQRKAQEAARLEKERQAMEARQAELEATRKHVEEEQVRLAKEKEASLKRAQEEEQRRLAEERAANERAEKEQVLQHAKEDAERKRIEEERLALEQERKRIQEEQARLAREKEASQKRAQEEGQRRLAEERAANERAEKEQALQRAKEDAEQKRIEEERLALGQERKRIQEEQARLAKERELSLQRARDEEQRRLAEARAAKERAENEKTLQRAKEEADRKLVEEEPKLAAQEAEGQKHIQIAKGTLRALVDRFRLAYEQRDLARLQDMSRMNDARLRNVQVMFANYTTFKVSVKSLSESEDGAIAVLVLDSATKPNGETVEFSPLAGKIRVTIPREGSGWGKILW